MQHTQFNAHISRKRVFGIVILLCLFVMLFGLSISVFALNQLPFDSSPPQPTPTPTNTVTPRQPEQPAAASAPQPLILVSRDNASAIEPITLDDRVDGVAEIHYRQGDASGSVDFPVFADARIAGFDEQAVLLELSVSEYARIGWLLETAVSIRLTPAQRIVEAPEQCEVHLNAQSVHDVIQIFPVPYFDLSETIGALSISLACEDDCPIQQIVVQRMMVMPDAVCEAQRYTCGLWYQVDWVRHGEDTPVIGWISVMDEDVQLIGDCTILPVIDPHRYYATQDDRTIEALLQRDSHRVIRQAGFTPDHTQVVVLRALPPAGYTLTSPEYVQVWDVASNTLVRTIEVGRESGLSSDFQTVFSTNHYLSGSVQAPRLIDITSGTTIAEAPVQRHVLDFAMTDDASMIVVAFQEFGYPADALWLWTQEIGWVDVTELIPADDAHA